MTGHLIDPVTTPYSPAQEILAEIAVFEKLPISIEREYTLSMMRGWLAKDFENENEDHRVSYSVLVLYVNGSRMVGDYDEETAVADYLNLHPEADAAAVRAELAEELLTLRDFNDAKVTPETGPQ